MGSYGFLFRELIWCFEMGSHRVPMISYPGNRHGAQKRVSILYYGFFWVPFGFLLDPFGFLFGAYGFLFWKLNRCLEMGSHWVPVGRLCVAIGSYSENRFGALEIGSHWVHLGSFGFLLDSY